MVTTANLWNMPNTVTGRAIWGLANRVDHDEIRTAIERQSSVVKSITVTAQGTGYTSAPTVEIGPPNSVPGTQAVATAALSTSGTITVSMVNEGLGYLGPPTVTLTGGGGSGATATATVNYKPLQVYPLDPIPENDLDQWFIWHQQTHDDMLNALNLPGSDQESVNFADPNELENWLFLHIQDHISCRKALGI
jgi:hypothetical protein